MSDDPTIGHNGGPPLVERSFKRRWAAALFAHPGTEDEPKPAGSVAMGFRLYMSMDAKGRGASISTEEFVDSCGVSDRAVRTFKGWLLAFGFVKIVSIGRRGSTSEFKATIPRLPAGTAAICNEIEAAFAEIEGADYRQEVPVENHEQPASGADSETQPATITGKSDAELPVATAASVELPATVTGRDDVQPAPPAAIPASRSLACLESSLREDTQQLQLVSEVKEEGGADALSARDAQTAFELWNELALRTGLSQARTLTPQRRKSLIARMREHGGLEAWKIALGHVERSAFLQGENDRGWRADLDFLLQASRFAKVVDGGYGNGAHAQAKESGLSKIDRMVDQAFDTLNPTTDQRRLT